MTDLYVACKTAGLTVDGKRHRIIKDKTVVTAAFAKGREDLFKPLGVHFGVEQATAAPGEKRTLSRPSGDDELDRLRAQAEAAGVKIDKRWGADKLREAIEAADAGGS